MRGLINVRPVLVLLTLVLAVAGSDASASTLRTELLTPGTFSKSTVKEQEAVQLKLSAPAYVERIFVAISFRSANSSVQVLVNGRPRGEISSPLRAADLEIDVRETANSIEFRSVYGVAEVEGVIAVLSSNELPTHGQSAAPVPAPAARPIANTRSGDVLRLMKKADRDLEALSRYLEPADKLGLVVPAQSAVSEVIVLAKAGRPMSDILPAVRILKEKLQQLEPIVNRMRAVQSRTERELANGIYVWSLEVHGLAD